MLHSRLLSALVKAGGKHRQTDNMHVVELGTQCVVWFYQEGSAICVHSPSAHTDIMTDCHCDTFHRTITSAVSRLKRGAQC